MKRAKFGIHENIGRNLVFIDGLTRSGKSVFSGILPSLDRAEHIQFFTLIEYLVPAVALGAADAQYAKALLRITLNELSYNMRLSRNVNFRPGDQTGIAKFREPGLYRSRLTRAEGEPVVKELRKTRAFIPFQTHDLLVNQDVLDGLDIDYKMIQLFRHPVDNVYSWWRTGWGDRFGEDPRAFTLTLQAGKKQVPWYCADGEKEWLKLNPMERCTETVIDLIERSVKQYKKASQKKRILLVAFEDFVQKSDKELARICRFLGTRPTRYTAKAMKAARCPRVLDPAEREMKREKIQKSVPADLFKRLEGLSAGYEDKFYGLKK